MFVQARLISVINNSVSLKTAFVHNKSDKTPCLNVENIHRDKTHHEK